MSKASCCGRAVVAVDGFGTAHHCDSAVVELGGDARLAFVFAPGDHTQAGNKNHGRIRVAQGGRIVVTTIFVISAIIGAIRFQARADFGFKRSQIAVLWVPIDIKRLDFGAQKMVGTAGAQFSQTRSVVRIDEAQTGCHRLESCR